VDVSSLVIRIIFLLLPGAIGSLLYRKLRGRAKRKDWEDFLEVIIFSLLSYAIYALIVYLINKKWTAAIDFTAFEAFFNEKVAVRWQDVLNSSLLSILLAVLASYFYTFNVINRVGKRIGATTRFGDEDVWDFFHHSPSVRGGWVTVRDHKPNLYYFGWVEAFSDSGKARELLLREVSVHDNSSGECIYTTEAMYLSRKQDELTIEAAVVSNEAERPNLEDENPQLTENDEEGTIEGK
jgi:uncharacterized protein DUF6338